MRLSFLPVFSLLSLTLSAPVNELSTRAPHSLPLPIDIVYKFPYPTWVQDLAVRANGRVLVTLLTTPDLWEIDPSGKRKARLVHHFREHLGLTGITEMKPNLYYVAGGNVTIIKAAGAATSTGFTLSGANVPGAWDIYAVDKSCRPLKIYKVAHVGQAINIDGITTLNAEKGLLLLSDSVAGLIYKLDVYTGKSETVIDDPSLKNVPTIAIGVHKLRIRDGYLYFDNSAQQTFVRIKINPDGTKAGEAEILSTGINSNGFDFDTKGDAFLTENTPNALGYVPVGGGPQTILAGVPLAPPETCPGVQSAQFGRTPADREVLYITTTGGLASQLGLPGTLSKVKIGEYGYYNRGKL